MSESENVDSFASLFPGGPPGELCAQPDDDAHVVPIEVRLQIHGTSDGSAHDGGIGSTIVPAIGVPRHQRAGSRRDDGARVQ